MHAQPGHVAGRCHAWHEPHTRTALLVVRIVRRLAGPAKSLPGNCANIVIGHIDGRHRTIGGRCVLSSCRDTADSMVLTLRVSVTRRQGGRAPGCSRQDRRKDGRQHGCMGARPCDVLGGHTTVKADGCVNRFHDGIRSGGETATPHRIGSLGHVEKVLSCAS